MGNFPMENHCFEVVDIPGKGRGLVAARQILGGETVLCDPPLLLVVDEQAKAYCCSHCFRMSTSVRLDRAPEAQLPRETVGNEQLETGHGGPETGAETSGLAIDENDVSFNDLGEPFQVHCESCSEVWFCGTECRQKASASGHSPLVCRILSKLGGSTLSSDEKNQARFLAAAVDLKASTQPVVELENKPEGGDTKVASSSGVNTKRANPDTPIRQPFDALLRLDGEPSETGSGSGALYAFLKEAVAERGEKVEAFDQETVSLLLCKDQRNSYGIMAPNGPEGERRLRASGTYMRAALINHNCLPNVARFDYFDKPGDRNTDVFLRALHDIPAGEEICQSYFPVSWPYELRQERLAEEYGFTCTCQRCLTEQAWSDEDEDGEGDDEETEGGDAGVTELEIVGTGLSKGKAKVVEAEGRGESSEEPERRALGDVGIGSESEEGGPLGGETAGQDDFQHAIFFVKYLCPDEDCGGTMAPLEGRWTGVQSGKGKYDPAEAMECNMCGKIRTDAEFESELALLEDEQAAELS